MPVVRWQGVLLLRGTGEYVPVPISEKGLTKPKYETILPSEGAMQEPLLYAIIAVTLVVWLTPAARVFIRIAREARPSEWLVAIPGIGLLLSLSAMPINLDAGIAGTMFFALLLLKR
jgi:hypothetical protein